MRAEWILTVLVFTSCAVIHEKVPRIGDEPKASTPSPTKGSELSFAWNRKDWDVYLVNAIKDHGLIGKKPSDWERYINVWPTSEQGQIKFWGNILTTMAKYESNWDPKRQYKENFKSSSNGKYVISRGLFQISKSSSSQKRYGCKWESESELHEPAKNIDCSVRIFAYWIKTDGVIRAYKSGWRGPARYWSVLRGTASAHTKKAYAAIKAANR